MKQKLHTYSYFLIAYSITIVYSFRGDLADYIQRLAGGWQRELHGISMRMYNNVVLMRYDGARVWWQCMRMDCDECWCDLQCDEREMMLVCNCEKKSLVE